MLLIAIPKSASTSLLRTLGLRHVIPATQAMIPDAPPPEGMHVLHRYHSDVREYPAEEIERRLTEGAIFKQHIPPTRRNVELLTGKAKAVLLRSPEEVVSAYWRAERQGLHPARPEFEGTTTLEQWRERAVEVGLLDDLRRFEAGWRDAASDGTTHLIEYEALIRSPDDVIRALESFWGLPPQSGTIHLARERYSRAPAAPAVKTGLRARLVRFLRRLARGP